jgi:RimK family alpha-L-glutamate ligase
VLRSHPVPETLVPKILVLGSDQGWHATELRNAAQSAGCEIEFALYESLHSHVRSKCPAELACNAGSLADFDILVTRTMPMGSFDQITFRLAVLHEYVRRGGLAINPPRSLEIAIDKFATLAVIADLGYDVPATRVVQSRREAMDAFRELGGDCVVKPMFGGEGRGVMRVREPELAWSVFATLDQLDVVHYVQAFVSPGGRDTRLLVIGNDVFAIRRINVSDFRTNVAGGGTCELLQATEDQQTLAKNVTRAIGLRFGTVDLLDCDHGPPHVVEVNGIPGWQGAQKVLPVSIAGLLIDLAKADLSERVSEAANVRL